VAFVPRNLLSQIRCLRSCLCFGVPFYPENLFIFLFLGVRATTDNYYGTTQQPRTGVTWSLIATTINQSDNLCENTMSSELIKLDLTQLPSTQCASNRTDGPRRMATWTFVSVVRREILRAGIADELPAGEDDGATEKLHSRRLKTR